MAQTKQKKTISKGNKSVVKTVKSSVRKKVASVKSKSLGEKAKKTAPKPKATKVKVSAVTAKVMPKKDNPVKAAVEAVQPKIQKALNTTLFFNPKEIMMNMNGNKNFEKMSQDAANISKDAMEACQKSATILAKNSQDCMASYMSMMQSAAEKQSKLMKEMLSKKTINEMSETLQSASQESFNDMMENMSRMSEQSIKAIMDSYEPINNQMNRIVKKASDMAA